MPYAPLVDIIPGVLAALWLVIAESRRLPLQNIVALSLLTTALGTGIEWGLFSALPPAAHPLLIRVVHWIVFLLGARALGRLMGDGHLFIQTLFTAICLAPSLILPQASRFPPIALRLGVVPIALLLLTPWWIRKPLAPAFAPRHAAMAAPLLATWLCAQSGLDGWAWARLTLAWLPVLWGLTRRPTPTAG